MSVCDVTVCAMRCTQFIYVRVCVCRFDQLRIQRQIHASEGKRAARGQASNRARLMFEAKLKTIHGAITVNAFSQPIILGKPVCLLPFLILLCMHHRVNLFKTATCGPVLTDLLI